MNKINFVLAIVLLLFPKLNHGQVKSTDANVVGHIVSQGKHIPFATVSLKESTIGVSADDTGHFMLVNLPVGKCELVASALGFQTVEKVVEVREDQTIEVNFELQEQVQGLNEVVVVGANHLTAREKLPTIVNAITPKLFAATQSVSISEGLNYTPGLRMETNCVNSGFPQLRINGMNGVYSQMLINGRRIFRGMASVFGLEQIPANIIDRVDIVRGGGSVLHGNNGIAGTINLILKDPKTNHYELGINSSLIGTGVSNDGSPAEDYTINMNTSVLSNDSKSGMTLFGFYRKRNPYDANDDSFSEIPKMENITLGSRIFHRMNNRNKLSIDLFNINETRRGGNQFELPFTQAEMGINLEQNILTTSINYEQFFKSSDKLSVYGAGQNVKSDAYRGVTGMPSVYDKTKEFSFSLGSQYKLNFDNSNVIVGIENDGAKLNNKKLEKVDGVPSNQYVIVADQYSNTFGVFSQYELKWHKFLISAGLRYEWYDVDDKGNSSFSKTGKVLTPRLSVKYDIKEELQARFNYSEGYRAPKIRDEDLMVHISGITKIIHQVSPDLKEEKSKTLVGSLDFNKQLGNVKIGFLVEGFYTRLRNPFVAKVSEDTENGVITYTRTNSSKQAKVRGINFEFTLNPHSKININGGYTIQRSEYTEPQEFNEKKFFKTPDSYGYMRLDWDTSEKFAVSVNGNYTGEMLVPIYGANTELRKTSEFLDMAGKIKYKLKIKNNNLQIFAGLKNIFNSYQDDFEKGINRYPGYIYGPRLPRIVFVGLKFGNIK
jgi:outer membrane receptor for ferrienterochelin and colicins